MTQSTPLQAATSSVLGECYNQMAALGNAHGRAKQHFHNTRHIAVVIDNARAIAAALGISNPLELAIIDCACAAHDWYQDFKPEGGLSFDGRKVLQRVRERGPNEDRSADQLVKLLNQANAHFSNVFPQDLILQGWTAVQWTYPEWLPAVGSFNHPRLRTYHSAHGTLPLIPLVVTWADLGHVGIDAQTALYFGKMEYLEVAWGIWDALAAAPKRGDIPQARQDEFKGHILAYFQGQSRFAEGRKGFVEEEIGMLPEKLRDSARKAFPAWNDTLALFAAEYERLSRVGDFYELAWILGFHPIPPA